MKVSWKNIFISVIAFSCVSTQSLYAINVQQKNILINVLYHHPTRGRASHYFSLPSTSTVGQLQQCIFQKLGIALKDQKLFVSKLHIERHPFDTNKNYVVEVIKVLLDPQRPLDNDSEFGIPIAKETLLGRYTITCIVGYVPPCFDLVCLSDFAHPHTLPQEFNVLFRENIVIKKTSTYDIIRNGLEMSNKTHMDNNDFKDF